ncbi:MAG TPA: hypothetical protein VNO55_27665, partial [Polyangia bacterium]|nr:hypothetical protein [Polyangia bacterium]
GSTTYQTQGAPTTTLTGTPSVGAGGVIVVTGTISPPSTGQTVRVIVRHPSGAIDYTDVPTTPTGTYTTTFPPGETGPVQVSVEVPPGGGPFDPVAIGDQVLGCGFLADKLAPKSCSGGPTKVDLGNIPAGCKAEIVSVDGTSLNPHLALSSGVVTLRPGNYVVHWTATNPALASRVSPDQTIAVVAQEPGLCCAAGQVAIVGTDQADSFTFTDNRAYCVVSGKGQDTVKTSSLADSLFGGPDGDLLFGGAGADLLVGGEGDDNLSSNGNLTALGGPGGDAISAANGKASILYGGAGADMLVGSPENDQLFPGSGANFTSGGQGNDTITILSACEIAAGAFIDGGLGTDTLVTPVSLATLQAMGVTVVSIEKVVVTSKDAHLSDCFPVTLAKPPACSTLPTWTGGGSYVPGSRVQNGGRSYECKPLPADRSCGDFDFQPGVSPNWPSAWKELGSCN